MILHVKQHVFQRKRYIENGMFENVNAIVECGRFVDVILCMIAVYPFWDIKHLEI